MNSNHALYLVYIQHTAGDYELQNSKVISVFTLAIHLTTATYLKIKTSFKPPNVHLIEAMHAASIFSIYFNGT